MLLSHAGINIEIRDVTAQVEVNGPPLVDQELLVAWAWRYGVAYREWSVGGCQRRRSGAANLVAAHPNEDDRGLSNV